MRTHRHARQSCVDTSILSDRVCVFFFNDTATTEIYTLSLHDALPISQRERERGGKVCVCVCENMFMRSEEHTSELQSHLNLVCRLLLETKRTESDTTPHITHTHPQPRPVAQLRTR